MTFLDRTTDPRRLRHWEGHLEADYIYTSGIAGERFFVALRDEGRILAARCTACGLAYLPPRMFCERCFGEPSEWVDVPATGKVAAVTVAHVDRHGNPLPEPQAWALVTFAGVHGGLVHRLLVPPRSARAGLAVRPLFRPKASRTGAITDLEGFEAASRGAVRVAD
ncbi:MAG: Zn-ribbon domain-containing OB-fold protein [Methanobacteriota archaeon]